MSNYAYCDREHPASDADAHRWCEMYHRPSTPRIAHGRSEDEACQAGTPGCAIDHVTDTPCETW
jgi:hypothetical protein